MLKKLNLLLKRYPVILSILLIGIVSVWVSSNYKWYDGFWKGIIRHDATGYYAYLPAVFIYQDLNFTYYDSLQQKLDNPVLEYNFLNFHPGGTINKYYAGTALLQTPFFFLGHLLSMIADRELNGYSAFYMISLQVGTIFYLLAGLFFLVRMLQTYGIEKSHIALILLCMVFGTNVFYYTTSEPGMSHIYSFFLVSAFLYTCRKLFLDRQYKMMPVASLLLGLIVLVRPVNLMILFAIPFIAGNRKQISTGFKLMMSQNLLLFISFVLFLSIIMIQLTIYRIQTGSFFVYSYSGEGFEFDDPDMLNILFSYRKGLFIYTPLLLVSLAGLYYIYKRSRFSFYAWTGFFLLITYVLSSWYMWYYGGSFSSRPYIEYLPLFAVPLGILLKHTNAGLSRKILVTVLFILMIFTQVQTYQYRKADIHWSEMDREKYWNAFPTPARIIDLFN